MTQLQTPSTPEVNSCKMEQEPASAGRGGGAGRERGAMATWSGAVGSPQRWDAPGPPRLLTARGWLEERTFQKRKGKLLSCQVTAWEVTQVTSICRPELIAGVAQTKQTKQLPGPNRESGRQPTVTHHRRSGPFPTPWPRRQLRSPAHSGEGAQACPGSSHGRRT